MASEPPYRDEDTLRQLYCEQGLTLEEISDKFDVSVSTIWTWVDRHGIETKRFDPPEERFNKQYERDEDSDCWIWTGAQAAGGYGQIHVNGRSMGAHRYSYKVHNDGIPDGAYICHTCHNKECVNPDHLYAGDAKTNAKDAVKNGDIEGVTATNRSDSALTKQQAREIREIYAETNATYATLSDEFGVSFGTLSRIITGESYPNAGGPTDTDTHDRMAKRGEDANKSKLTESDVRAIRDEYGTGDVTMAELGDRYDISATNISDIINRNTWQHIE